jgi:hypothetical protein
MFSFVGVKACKLIFGAKLKQGYKDVNTEVTAHKLKDDFNAFIICKADIYLAIYLQV